jgi:SHS2 domain-containing protein
VPWQFVDHTADLICRVEAPTLPSLFEEAALALTSLFVDDPGSVRPSEWLRFELAADDPAELLLDWLQALLVAFEVRHTLFAGFRVTLVPGRLRASAGGERVDPARHRLAHEVKAITYHGLALRETAEGWQAEVLVDV